MLNWSLEYPSSLSGIIIGLDATIYLVEMIDIKKFRLRALASSNTLASIKLAPSEPLTAYSNTNNSEINQLQIYELHIYASVLEKIFDRTIHFHQLLKPSSCSTLWAVVFQRLGCELPTIHEYMYILYDMFDIGKSLRPGFKSRQPQLTTWVMHFLRKLFFLIIYYI